MGFLRLLFSSFELFGLFSPVNLLLKTGFHFLHFRLCLLVVASPPKATVDLIQLVECLIETMLILEVTELASDQNTFLHEVPANLKLFYLLFLQIVDDLLDLRKLDHVGLLRDLQSLVLNDEPRLHLGVLVASFWEELGDELKLAKGRTFIL